MMRVTVLARQKKSANNATTRHTVQTGGAYTKGRERACVCPMQIFVLTGIGTGGGVACLLALLRF